MNIIIEYDDLHFLYPENCIDAIDALVLLYPKIKLSFFVPAFLRKTPIYHNADFCNRLIKHIENNNVHIGIHGNEHSLEEFKNISYDTAKEKILDSERILSNAGISFVKCFRGPHWGINADSIRALSDLGYSHLYNHKDYLFLDTYATEHGLTTVYYDFSLGETININKYSDNDIVVLHGHTHDVCNNGIEETFDNLCMILESHNPNFLFIDEY